MAFRPPTNGELINHVYIQQESKTPDGMGGNAVTWDDVVDVWARVDLKGGREPFSHEQDNTSKIWFFAFRYVTGITADMQIKDKDLNVAYNIRSVSDPTRRHEWTLIEAEELYQNTP